MYLHDSHKPLLSQMVLPAICICLWLTSCNSTTPSAPAPKYLADPIKQRPPEKDGLTAYPANTPWGGAVSSLAGQGNVLFANTRNGIYQSSNGGKSWQYVQAMAGNVPITKLGQVEDLAVLGKAIFATLRLYAQVAGRPNVEMYRSGDAGLTWKRLDEPALNGLTGVDDLRAAGEYLYAVFRFESGRGELYRTNKGDGGWERVTSSLPTGVLFEGTAIGKTIFICMVDHKSLSGSIYRSDGEGGWTPIPVRQDKPVVGHITNIENSLFAFGYDPVPFIYRLNNDGASWSVRSAPQEVDSLDTLSALGNTLIIGTNKGVYYQENDAGAWNEANAGMHARACHDPIVVAARQFVVADEGNSKPLTGGSPAPGFSPQIYRSDDEGETWQVTSFGDLENTGGTQVLALVATKDKKLFASGRFGVYRSEDFGGSWERVGRVKHPAGDQMISGVRKLTSLGDDLFALPTQTAEATVLRSRDRGETWEPINEGLNGEVVENLATIDNSVVAVTDRGLSRFNQDGQRWESIINESVGEILVPGAGKKILVGTTSGSKGLAEIDMSARQPFRRGLGGAHLNGELLSIFADPDYPNVIMVGTTEGLFWSSDGGDEFREASHDPDGQPFHQVLSISRVDNQLLIGTDAGLFYVYDQVPRGNWYEGWLARLGGNTWLLSGTAIALLMMVVLSTRLISILLQLEIWGIDKIAPVFYLSPLGRWKLYRRYRQRLRTASQMTSSYEHFIDLPFESDSEIVGQESADPADQALKLSDFFAKLPATKRVVVIAEGGRGKSTLVNYLARRSLERRDIFQGKRSEPVVINGLSYSGDLLGALANALNQNRAYVNKSIVSSQMAAGNLLVIFDGFSEIRETYLAAASRDLAELVNKPDTPFIFTSRSTLPSEVYNALGDCTTIKLRDVDETTISPFLAQYLKRGDQEVDALMKEIEVHFKALPRIPLMLKLVATVYDQKARVPKDTVTLFADYAEQVLRPDATGINEPIGLHYAIRQLVRETYLRSGGDRGLTLDQGVELLEKIKDRLESYEITMAPIKLLRVLIRAGLYEQIDSNLRFFHDSFESYFAARTLENDFREKRYELIGMCAGNQRLKETWSFLEAMLDKPEDAERLRQVVVEISPKRDTRLREVEQLLGGNPYPRIPRL